MALGTKHSAMAHAHVRHLEEARGIYTRAHVPERRLLEEAAVLLRVERHTDSRGICNHCAQEWPCAVARWHQNVLGEERS